MTSEFNGDATVAPKRLNASSISSSQDDQAAMYEATATQLWKEIMEASERILEATTCPLITYPDLTLTGSYVGSGDP